MSKKNKLIGKRVKVLDKRRLEWQDVIGVAYEAASHAPYETLQQGSAVSLTGAPLRLQEQGSEKESPIQNLKSKIQNGFIGADPAIINAAGVSSIKRKEKQL